MKLTEQQLLLALEELRISVEEFSSIRIPASLSVMTSRLDAFKARAKKSYHEAARRLHPDVNPDPEAAERFKIVVEVYNQIEALQIRERRPEPQVVWTHVSYSNSTATTEWSGGTIHFNIRVKS